MKVVPAPVPVSSSSSSSSTSLILVLQAVAVPGAASSAGVLLTVGAGVQGSSPAPVPPGSVGAWRGSLLAPATAPTRLDIVPSVLGLQVVPAIITVPAVVIVSIIVVGGRGVILTVCARGGGWLQGVDLTRSLHRLIEKKV